jgi:hypothetical protein
MPLMILDSPPDRRELARASCANGRTFPAQSCPCHTRSNGKVSVKKAVMQQKRPPMILFHETKNNPKQH